MSADRARWEGVAARAWRVLDLAGVRCPEEIDIDLLAADYGICAIPKDLDGHDGNIVRLGKGPRALVAIARHAFGKPTGRFTLAHEPIITSRSIEVSLSLSCVLGQASERYYAREREADVFAVELLLAAPFFVPEIAGRAPTLALERALAARFSVSLTATAFRLVELTDTASAVVLSRGGVIVKHDETDDFPVKLVRGFALGPAAFAYDEEVLTMHESAGSRDLVRADAFSRAKKATRIDLVEQSMRLGRSGLVLTLLTPR